MSFEPPPSAGEWVARLLPHEIARRTEIAIFLQAGQEFLKDLHAQMRLDVQAYNEATKTKAEAVLHQSKIVASHPQLGMSVVIRVNPFDKTLVYKNSLSDQFSGWIRASVEHGRFALDHPEVNTIQFLSERLLMPILFPTFTEDAATLDYLKRQFDPS